LSSFENGFVRPLREICFPLRRNCLGISSDGGGWNAHAGKKTNRACTKIENNPSVKALVYEKAFNLSS
tara:strand:+ start:238 stop:441 length:204 start_codon:yes stop_codon:yes gene_type:complete